MSGRAVNVQPAVDLDDPGHSAMRPVPEKCVALIYACGLNHLCQIMNDLSSSCFPGQAISVTVHTGSK